MLVSCSSWSFKCDVSTVFCWLIMEPVFLFMETKIDFDGYIEGLLLAFLETAADETECTIK